MSTYKGTAANAVLVGYALPAHDEVFDLAEKIGGALADLHDYITSVRSAGQADSAINELLDALKVEVTV